jgi:hypothetical protein
VRLSTICNHATTQQQEQQQDQPQAQHGMVRQCLWEEEGWLLVVSLLEHGNSSNHHLHSHTDSTQP